MKKITIGTLALCFALGLAANDDIETTRIKTTIRSTRFWATGTQTRE